jgi:predicted amidohydrolase
VVAAPYRVEENRVRAADAVTTAFAEGANVVVLPEMMVTGYALDRGSLLPVAEPVPGPTTETWGELAQEGGGYVVGGSVSGSGMSCTTPRSSWGQTAA